MNSSRIVYLRFAKSFFFLFFLFISNFLIAQNNCKSANGGGNWQLANSWTDCGGNSPTNIDNAIITQGNPISLQNVKTINNLTVEENASFTSNTGNPALNVTGDLRVDGTMTGIGVVTLSGLNKTISGQGNIANSAAIQITGNKIISTGTNIFLQGDVSILGLTTITNQGEISISGNISGNSSSCIWTNDERSVLNIGGTIFSTTLSGILNASAIDNTVNFFRTSITIPVPSSAGTPSYPTYHNVTISGSGSKTLPNVTLAINGNLTLNSTLNGNGGQKIVRLRGNWINNSSTGFTEGSGTVIFDGVNDQYINKATVENFNNVIIEKNGGTLFLNTDVIIGATATSILTMNLGNINCGSKTLTLGRGTGTGPTYTGNLIHNSGIIIGKFKRFIESPTSPAAPVLFPVGTTSIYRPALITFSDVSVIGSVIASFNTTFPGSIGLPDAGLPDPDGGVRSYNTFRDGFWTIAQANSFSSTNFSISLTGTDFIELPTDNTRILRRVSAPEPNLNTWGFNGLHIPYVAYTLPAVNWSVGRSGLNNIFGDFAFGDDTDCTNPGTPQITGVSNVCKDELSPSLYSVDDFISSSTYNWIIQGSSISSYTNSGSNAVEKIDVTWGNEPVEGNLSVFETTIDGCSGPSAIFPVNVLAPAPASISGLNDVPQNVDGLKPYQDYSTPVKSYYTAYEWTVTGGEIVEVDGLGNETIHGSSFTTTENSIKIKWGDAGVGTVCVKGITASCGSSESTCFSVSIYSLIYTVGTGVGDWGATTPAHKALWNCNCIPTASDNIFITPGKTVTVSVPVTVKNLIVAGELRTGNQTSKTITVNGNLTFINGTIAQNATVLAPLILGGEFGPRSIDGIGTITNQADLIIRGANRTITAASNITKTTGAILIEPGITVINNGIVTLGGNITGSNDDSAWINSSDAILNFGGSSLLSTGTLIASFQGNTIHYNNLINPLNIGLIQPVKSASYFNLELSGDGQKLAPAVLNVGGSFTNNGTATTGTWIGFNPNNGTVTFNGTDGPSQILGSAPLTTFQNITANNTSGVYVEKNVDVLGILNVGPGAFIDVDGLNDDRVLTLRSLGDFPTIDASVGVLPSNNAVRGKVTVQRYMSPEGRLYRYLSAPVSGVNVSDWMDDFPVTGRFPDRSTMIQWPIAQLCENTPLLISNASLFYYNEAIAGDKDLGYIAYPFNVQATLSPLDRGRGYAAFNRLCAEPTIIDVSGSLYQGSFDLPVDFNTTSGGLANDGWNLVGNPYASAIDWDNEGWIKVNLDPIIAITDNGTGIRKYWDGDDVGGYPGEILPGGVIASGQAFWVKANGNGAPKLTINETVKVNNIAHAFYRKSNTNTVISSMTISLNNKNITDYAFIKIREKVSVELDKWDATKLNNDLFDLATLTPSGVPMAINSIPEVAEGMEIPLLIKDAEEGIHSLKVEGKGDFIQYQVEVTDHFLKTKKIVNWGDDYEFYIGNENESAAAKRISLRLVKPGTIIERKELFTLSAYPNPVKGMLTIDLGDDLNYKTITIFNSLGGRTEQINIEPGIQKSQIDFSSHPAGVYLIYLVSSGYTQWVRVIKN